MFSIKSRILKTIRRSFMKAFSGFLVLLAFALAVSSIIAPAISKAVDLAGDNGAGADNAGGIGCCGSIIIFVLAFILDSGRKT